MGKLDGKRIIVTGGAGGIGNAAVRLFAAEGARVACTFNSAEPEVPAGVHTARCNIADKAEVNRVFDHFAEALGGLDVLVHAAGKHGSQAAELVGEQDWDAMFDLNGKATVWTNQAAFRHMREHGGSIVNMGSVEGVRGFAGNAIYAASRGAVMAWTRSVALEWGTHGVRVNCVAPAIHTEIFERQRQQMDAATLRDGRRTSRRRDPARRQDGRRAARPRPGARLPRRRRLALHHRPDPRGRRRPDDARFLSGACAGSPAGWPLPVHSPCRHARPTHHRSCSMTRPR